MFTIQTNWNENDFNLLEQNDHTGKIYKEEGSGMIANETTLHKRANDTEVKTYRSPYGLQQ